MTTREKEALVKRTYVPSFTLPSTRRPYYVIFSWINNWYFTIKHLHTVFLCKSLWKKILKLALMIRHIIFQIVCEIKNVGHDFSLHFNHEVINNFESQNVAVNTYWHSFFHNLRVGGINNENEEIILGCFKSFY